MLCMPSLTSPRPQCSLQKLSNQISAATKEKEIIEAEDLTETTVKFVQIKEITATNPLTVSTANALIATNAVIPKRTVSLSKTTKLVLVINQRTLVCNPNTRPMATTATATPIPINPVPTVNTIRS